MPLSRRFASGFAAIPLFALLGLACGTSVVSFGDRVPDASPPFEDDQGRDAGSFIDGSTPDRADARPSDARVDGAKNDARADTGAQTTGALNAEKYCSPLCDFDQRCSKNISACSSGGAPCLAQTTPIAAFWRDEYTDAFSTCYPALPCASSPDNCIVDGFVASDPAWPEVSYVQDCLAKRKACSSPFADDLCLSLVALTDVYRAQADACRTLACGQVGACLRAAGAFSY